jgi:Flp pilus assembly protein CpaB
VSSNLRDVPPEGMRSLLPPGTRGYLLGMSKSSVPALEPGQHVDIVVTYGPTAHRLNEVVTRNVLLIAVGQGIAEPYKGSIVLTLAVDPTEIDKLERAKRKRGGTILVQVAKNKTQ